MRPSTLRRSLLTALVGAVVGMTGFERLAALFRGVTPARRTGVLDGTAGWTETSPLTAPATC